MWSSRSLRPSYCKAVTFRLSKGHLWSLQNCTTQFRSLGLWLNRDEKGYRKRTSGWLEHGLLQLLLLSAATDGGSATLSRRARD